MQFISQRHAELNHLFYFDFILNVRSKYFIVVVVRQK